MLMYLNVLIGWLPVATRIQPNKNTTIVLTINIDFIHLFLFIIKI